MSASGSSGTRARSGSAGSTAAMHAMERIGRRLGRLDHLLALLLAGELPDRLVAAAVEAEGVGRVEEGLDQLGADRGILDIAADPIGPGLELGQRLLRLGGAGEGKIVLEEVVMAVDVGDGQHLQAEAVVAHQVGEAGVGIDDHLVGQTLHAVVVHGLGLLERLAVGPVRVVRRHAVIGHVAEHGVLIADLELLRIAVEPELVDLGTDDLVPALELGQRPIGHRPSLSSGWSTTRPAARARCPYEDHGAREGRRRGAALAGLRAPGSGGAGARHPSRRLVVGSAEHWMARPSRQLGPPHLLEGS